MTHRRKAEGQGAREADVCRERSYPIHPSGGFVTLARHTFHGTHLAVPPSDGSWFYRKGRGRNSPPPHLSEHPPTLYSTIPAGGGNPGAVPRFQLRLTQGGSV